MFDIYSRAGRFVLPLLLLILIAPAADVLASAGRLDTTFHPPDGLAVYAEQTPMPEWGQRIAVDSQGRLLVCGGGSIFRFLPDGARDTSFTSVDVNSVLRQVGLFLASGDQLYTAASPTLRLAIQGDGRICVFMNVSDLVRDYDGPEADRGGILRLNEDGSPDTSFSPSGFRQLNYFLHLPPSWFGGPPFVKTIAAVAGEDGRVVISTDSEKGMFRLNLDGSLDLSFGTDGYRTFPYSWPEDHLYAPVAMVATDGGKILGLCPGERFLPTYRLFYRVTRFMPDGSTDPTFSSAELQSGNDWWRGDLLSSAAGLLVGGLKRNPGTGSYDLGLTALHADGSLNTDFGAGGTLITDLGEPDFHAITSVAYAADGNVLAAYNMGYVTTETGYDIRRAAVRRLDAKGTPDTTFADNGLFSWAPSDFDSLEDVVLLGDGSLRLTGAMQRGCFAFTDLLLLALDANGALDPAFGSSGLVLAKSDLTYDAVGYTSALAAPDGGVLLNAQLRTAEGSPTLLLKYTGEGAVDGSFDTAGSLRSAAVPSHGYVPVFIPGSGGKIVLTDDSYDCDGHMRFDVCRLNADGSRDPSFGSGGVFSFHSRPVDAVSSTLVDRQGRIVLIGTSGDPGHRANNWDDARMDLLVIRLTSEGSPDPTFGTGGVYRHRWLKNTSGGSGATLPDGSLLISAYTYSYSVHKAVLIKLDPTGQPDPAFGDQGFIFGPELELETGMDFSGGILALTGGRFLVAGYRGSDDHGYLARRLADGSVDSSFGDKGYVDFTDSPFVIAQKIDRLGRILLTADGQFPSPPAPRTLSRIWRLLPDGQIDKDFGEGGNFTLNRSAVFLFDTLDLDPQGRVVGNAWVDGSDLMGYGFGRSLTFRLTEEPGITLLAPQPGDQLRSGKSFTIGWQPYRKVAAAAKVRMQFSLDNGQTWKSIGTAPFAAGSYNWKVPRVFRANKRCRLRLELQDAGGKALDVDANDRPFTIAP